MLSAELSGKIMYAAFRKMVSERLGTIKKDAFEQMAKDLTEEERLQFAAEILQMTEMACGEFITEMRLRLEKEYAKVKKP